MFGFLRLIGSMFSLNTLKFLGVGILGVGIYLSYNFITNKFDQLDKANILLAQQTKVITDLNESITLLKASNELTLESLKNLEENKIKSKEIGVKRATVVASKISVIDASEQVSDKLKEQQKSEIYIDDLFNTICQINNTPCITEETK